MRPLLVDDRFLRKGPHQWLDIASGDLVETSAEPRPVAAPVLDEAQRCDLAAVIDHIVRAADARSANGIRCIQLAVHRAPLVPVLSEAARALRRLGFVAVRASVDVPDEIRRALCHRHVVIMTTDRDGQQPESVARWIRDLTAVSARSHLVVTLRTPPNWLAGAVALRAQSGVVRERMAMWDSQPHTADWHARIRLAAASAATLIQAGCLQRAESLLQSLVVEAAARQEEMPQAARLKRSQLRFWQGRFEEAAVDLEGIQSADPEMRAWQALAAWANGDPGALVVARGFLPPACGLARAVDIELRLVEGRPCEARRLLALSRGGDERAGPLDGALARWLTVRCTGESQTAPPAQVIRFIRASGARGILRWGRGRSAMNLVHDVTTLLQVVHDAEDEYTALRQGCSWVRQQTGADAVGITVADGTRLIAGIGLSRSDLEQDDLRAAIRNGHGQAVVDGPHALVINPVRYGGATIGVAMIRGRRDITATLADAAMALATACAPALRARLDALSCAGAADSLAPEILGRSPAIVALREAIARAAGTSFPVLIEGESGTGKELVARALHRLSARRDRRFSALNCAALSDELVEAELFGYARGAFTGAINPRVGLFEDASGGTLFLDEVSELSARAQAKLLRVLQEREIRRVGEQTSRPIDVRVIAATNLPLTEAAGRGRFREDLLFRLAVIRIRVAPLRDRLEDVPLLAQTFWASLMGQTPKRALLGPDAIVALCRHRWHGNVRELQNAVAALVVAAPTRGRVTARHVSQVLAGPPPDPEAWLSLDSARQAFERRMVVSALARHGGRQTRAARDLGLSRQGLAKAIKRLGLQDSNTGRQALLSSARCSVTPFDGSP